MSRATSPVRPRNQAMAAAPSAFSAARRGADSSAERPGSIGKKASGLKPPSAWVAKRFGRRPVDWGRSSVGISRTRGRRPAGER